MAARHRPEIVSTLLRRQRHDDPLERLTRREHEVLALMVAGSSNQGIADALTITVRAVEKYISSIFGKLDLPATCRRLPRGCSPSCTCCGPDQWTLRPELLPQP